MNLDGDIFYDAVIVGAGFAGLQQLHFLRDKLGMKVLVLEAAGGVGGTWYWNRYPGASCDSESHTYCFYFSEDLLKEWRWTEKYPGQKEILNYLNFVTDRLKLRPNINFETRVKKMQYQDLDNSWIITTDQNKKIKTRFVVSAVGCLSSANSPNIAGKEEFKGELYHTGTWPHNDVSFEGKRVGVIGTGSSGIQAIPIIAESAKELTVFQRTPNFSVPSRNKKLSKTFFSKFKSDIEYYRSEMLAARHGHPWTAPDSSVAKTSKDAREEIFEKAWEIGGLRFRESFGDTLTNLESNNLMSDFIKRKISEKVKNSETAKTLSNFDHPFGTKRPALDTSYFETFNKENVNLVDIRIDPIKKISRCGLETETKTFNFDMLVFATGFDALTGSILKMGVEGRNGVLLSDQWSEGPKTYLGVQVAGFPNLFIVTGPGSPSVLTNMPQAIDQNVRWITECISYLNQNNLTNIEADVSAMDKWMEHVQDVVTETLFPIANHSWYLGANIPGKPQIFMPYVGGLNNYRIICSQIAENEYEGFSCT